MPSSGVNSTRRRNFGRIRPSLRRPCRRFASSKYHRVQLRSRNTTRAAHRRPRYVTAIAPGSTKIRRRAEHVTRPFVVAPALGITITIEKMKYKKWHNVDVSCGVNFPPSHFGAIIGEGIVPECGNFQSRSSTYQFAAPYAGSPDCSSLVFSAGISPPVREVDVGRSEACPGWLNLSSRSADSSTVFS
jgi:hypothetical protein